MRTFRFLPICWLACLVGCDADDNGEPIADPIEDMGTGSRASLGASRSDGDCGDLSSSCCDALREAGDPRALDAAIDACVPDVTSETYFDTAGNKDCINSTCGGPVSCAKLKTACNYVAGAWGCSKRSDEGVCTNGSCKKCYD